MLKAVVAFGMLASSAASAQSVSYTTDNPARIKGDRNKIVCQKEDKIGTRLGGKKVCLTVAEWQMRQDADRDAAPQLQASTQAPCYEGCGAGLKFGDISQTH